MKLKHWHTLPFFLIGGIHLIKITTDRSEFAARTDPEMNLSLQLPAALSQLKSVSLSPKDAIRAPHNHLAVPHHMPQLQQVSVALFSPASDESCPSTLPEEMGKVGATSVTI